MYSHPIYSSPCRVKCNVPEVVHDLSLSSIARGMVIIERLKKGKDGIAKNLAMMINTLIILFRAYTRKDLVPLMTQMMGIGMLGS